MPSIRWSNSDIPLHLRPSLARLEDRPQIRPLENLAEVCCMVRETGNAGIKAKTKFMCCADGSLIIPFAFGQQGIYAMFPEGRE